MKTSSKKTTYQFPVIIEKDENGYFVGKVTSLKSCYTQAKTLPELYQRLPEVVGLCLEIQKDLFKKEIKQNQFIGVQQLEFSA